MGLDQGAGYGIVVGFGFFFVFLTIALVFGDYRARGGPPLQLGGLQHCRWVAWRGAHAGQQCVCQAPRKRFRDITEPRLPKLAAWADENDMDLHCACMRTAGPVWECTLLV